MRDAIRACLVVALLVPPTAPAADAEPKVAVGDNPWLISEFRPAQQAVVVGEDVLGLTPEATASLREQLAIRDRQRQGRPAEDTQFSATVSVGRDVAGRPVITAIAVH